MDHVSMDLIVECVFAVVFWLLRQKDVAQEKQITALQKQIELLFKKHDDDVVALAQLQLHVAGHHYQRDELDVKFDRLQDTFKEGFNSLGSKFDDLTRSLIAHISREESSNKALASRACTSG